MTKSRITTKQGDRGETTALSGDRHPKSHPIIECVGVLDELRAHTALVRQLLLERKARDCRALSDFLLWLLHAYFPLGSACSDPANKHPEYRKVEIGARHVERLEAEQLRLEREVCLPGGFVAGASNRLAAEVDVACAVARRFERALVRLAEVEPAFQTEHVFAFVNRLSDYLYVLARYLEEGRHVPVDYGCIE